MGARAGAAGAEDAVGLAIGVIAGFAAGKPARVPGVAGLGDDVNGRGNGFEWDIEVRQ